MGDGPLLVPQVVARIKSEAEMLSAHVTAYGHLRQALDASDDEQKDLLPTLVWPCSAGGMTVEISTNLLALSHEARTAIIEQMAAVHFQGIISAAQQVHAGSGDIITCFTAPPPAQVGDQQNETPGPTAEAGAAAP